MTTQIENAMTAANVANQKLHEAEQKRHRLERELADARQAEIRAGLDYTAAREQLQQAVESAMLALEPRAMRCETCAEVFHGLGSVCPSCTETKGERPV